MTTRVIITWKSTGTAGMTGKWLMGGQPSDRDLRKMRRELADAILDAGIVTTELEAL